MNQPFQQLCKHYLEVIYRDISSSGQRNNIAETSGDVLYDSVNKLIPFLNLNEDDVFIDLGSSTGKVVSQIFLLTAAKTVMGVEIVSDCHASALSIAERMQADLPEFYENDRKMVLIHGDFLNISLSAVTVAFINAVCFPASLVDKLGVIINNNPSIRQVISLRPILTLERLPFKKTIPVECSWDSGLCYVYA